MTPREQAMERRVLALQETDFSQGQRDKLADKGKAMPDGSFPIRNARDLGNAIQALGRAKDPAAARAHIISRAKALKLTSKLPDGWKVQESAMARRAKEVEDRLIAEAADSMRKASTPEPFSHSKTSNWVARGGGLPAYIQHIAHDLMEKRGMDESRAIGMAIGIVKRWARGGGKVHPDTRAAAAKALAEWERLKAGAHAKAAG